MRQIEEWFLLRLEAGEEVITSLRAWAAEHNVGFAILWAIGAMRRAKLASFDPSTNTYHPFLLEEPLEVVSITGNIARGAEDEPIVHAHAVLGREDGSAVGGHLMEGEVSPLLEVVVRVLPTTVHRRLDPAIGLTVWDL